MPPDSPRKVGGSLLSLWGRLLQNLLTALWFANFQTFLQEFKTLYKTLHVSLQLSIDDLLHVKKSHQSLNSKWNAWEICTSFQQVTSRTWRWHVIHCMHFWCTVSFKIQCMFLCFTTRCIILLLIGCIPVTIGQQLFIECHFQHGSG